MDLGPRVRSCFAVRTPRGMPNCSMIDASFRMDGREELLQRARALVDSEQGTLCKQAPLRVALCYPSPYFVGMSSLGYQPIYREVNAPPNACAERAFGWALTSR